MSHKRTLGYLTLDTGPAETIMAAASAGFDSVGIRITGRRIADPFTPVIGQATAIRDLRQRLDDTGITLSNISAYHFYPDVGHDDLERVMDTVMELGARIVVVNSYDPDEARFIDALAPYCAQAAAGSVRVAIEFMRYSAVKTLTDALRIVTSVGAANLGLLIDPLHLARSGGSPADLAAVDPAKLVFAQLCDAKRIDGDVSESDLRLEARSGRLYPGDGALPLRAFIDALPSHLEIEYEVPRQDLGWLTLDERARVAFSVFTTFLDGPPARR